MEDLFEGLPPPSTAPEPPPDADIFSPAALSNARKRQHLRLFDALHPSPSPPPVPNPPPPPPPKSALKSALKRPKLESSIAEAEDDAAPKKRIRFNTMANTPEQQVIDAMKKISSHIGIAGKFSKASKLAVQLIQAGRVQPSTSDYLFSILESAMSSPIACTDPSVRADFHALFTDAQEVAYCFNTKQQRQFGIWTLRALVANDLFTDDSFLFSRTAAHIREEINGLPCASESEDKYEATSLPDKKEPDSTKLLVKPELPTVSDSQVGQAADPFGLDDLIPSASAGDDKTRVKKESGNVLREGKEEGWRMVEEEECRRILEAKREALLTCLEIAARRYKTPWCQTTIDIMAKHAFENGEKFTSKQREAIRKLWNSIREQQTRRKQGKSVSGELDVSAFEWLQQKYSTEKISIRRAVGGSGDRKCQQWLG